jgi:hypothetical protein
MSSKHQKLASSILITAIILLASLIGFFQIQTNNFQNQTLQLQNQLSNYKNQTSNLQTKINNLSTQLYDLKNPAYNVTIQSITSTSWEYLGGMSMDKFFTISIKNVGLKDVGGLTFEFKILDNGTVWNSTDYRVGMMFPRQLGVLHAGESTTIDADISSSIGVSFVGKIFVATVIWDKTVLDEQTVIL